MSNLLLYDLFTEWNNQSKARVKLGYDDYWLLLQLMDESVFPFRDFDDFAFACETLWLKDVAQKEAFRKCFDRRRKTIEDWIGLLTQTENRETASTVPEAETTPAGPTDAGAEQQKAGRDSGDGSVQEKTDTASRKKKEEGKKTPEEPEDGVVTLALGSGAAAETATNVSSAKGFSVPDGGIVLPPSKQYLFGTEYFPVPGRALQQSWRTLYSNREANEAAEVDLKKTVTRICREGIFTDFEYEAGESNLLSLFIFIDQGGSMIACEEFGKELVKSAFASEAHRDIKPYFFHNVPLPHPANPDQGYVLYNEQKTKAASTFAMFKKASKKNIVLLIYSDAGAIKGNRDDDRISATLLFLKYMCARTAYIAWLNPAPEHRWQGTGAGAIAEKMPEVPMFEAGRTGMAQVIHALKGKLVQPLKQSP